MTSNEFVDGRGPTESNEYLVPDEFRGTMTQENRAMYGYLNTLLHSFQPNRMEAPKAFSLLALGLHLTRAYLETNQDRLLDSNLNLKTLDMNKEIKEFLDLHFATVTLYAMNPNNPPLMRLNNHIKPGEESSSAIKSISHAIKSVALGHGGWGIINFRARLRNLFANDAESHPDYKLIENYIRSATKIIEK